MPAASAISRARLHAQRVTRIGAGQQPSHIEKRVAPHQARLVEGAAESRTELGMGQRSSENPRASQPSIAS